MNSEITSSNSSLKVNLEELGKVVLFENSKPINSTGLGLNK